MSDPAAQGETPLPEIQSQGDQAPQQQNAVPQQRFDQVYAEREDYRRQAEQAAQQAAAMQAQYLQVMERMALQRAEPQAPPPEIDPSISAALDYHMKRYLSPVQEQAARAQAEAASLRAQLEFRDAASQYQPQVVQKAQELMQTWRRNGFTGWAEKDALVYASGLLGIPATNAAAQSRDALGRFNAGAQVLMGQSAPPPATTPRKVVDVDRSATDSRYFENQAALLEKELGDFEF